MAGSIAQVAAWIRDARSVVAFTGAGISTESGIPDYRSPGGIWATSQPVMFDDFMRSSVARYEYWRQKAISHRDFMRCQPNDGHRTLAKWEQAGHLAAVITQNIDGLHQEAGSRNVFELHGTARYIGCLDCGARFEADPLVQQFLADDTVPPCPECRGERLKHATISFGQVLDEGTLTSSIELCRTCDVLLAMGSSLVVEPAASLPRLAGRQGRVIIINRDPTPQDATAAAVFHDSIGRVLVEIDKVL